METVPGLSGFVRFCPDFPWSSRRCVAASGEAALRGLNGVPPGGVARGNGAGWRSLLDFVVKEQGWLSGPGARATAGGW
jgi:hypothetical protein